MSILFAKKLKLEYWNYFSLPQSFGYAYVMKLSFFFNFICVKNFLSADSSFVTLENITLKFRVVEIHVIAQLQKCFLYSGDI